MWSIYKISYIAIHQHELSEKEISKSTSLTITSKRIKYLGVNLIKELKGLHTENYETLMIEIKTDTISGEKSMLMDEMLMIKCPYGLCFPIFPSLPFLCYFSSLYQAQ